MSEKQHTLYQSLFVKLKRSTSGESELYLLFFILSQVSEIAVVGDFSHLLCL